MAHLELTDVSYAYESSSGSAMPALDSLTLDVAAGESVAVIGPSGCGKSTMLLMAAGLLEPDSGTVRIDGAPVSGPRDATALILQDFGLLEWRRVIDNAALGLKIRGVARSERTERAMRALAAVGLEEFAGAWPRELSGGMRQRLALARALALDVDLMLMDEPMSALDALLREELQETLVNLWLRERYAQVIVTHSIEEAVFLGERIYVFSARPGHVAGVVDNPGVGSDGWRASDEFGAQVRRLRGLIAIAAAPDAHFAPDPRPDPQTAPDLRLAPDVQTAPDAQRDPRPDPDPQPAPDAQPDPDPQGGPS